MNEEVKNYIIERCVKAGMGKPYDLYGDRDYLLFFNEYDGYLTKEKLKNLISSISKSKE